MILFLSLLIFKTINSWLEGSDLLSVSSTVTQSNTDGSQISTGYFEVVQIILSLSAIYMIKRVKYQRSNLLVLTLIVFMNGMCIVKFYFDRESPLI